MGDRNKIGNIILKAAIILGFILVFFFMWYYNFRQNKAREIVLKSRYTFSVRIDAQGNVLKDADEAQTFTPADDFSDLKIDEIGDIWIREFTAQYTQKYLPWSKSLKKVEIEKTKTLDASENVVLIGFSASVNEKNAENFASWNGVLDNGRMSFEWVVTFYIDNHYDGTATVYVKSIVTPEDYGIAQYNESKNNSVSGIDEIDDTDKKSLTQYEIKNNTLSVTYDGGEKYVTVPVDTSNLLMADDSETELKRGSYYISTTKTAFVYGGKTSGSDRIPVTLIYSNDMGANWITCEIENIYTATYYYVEFFDENSGVLVIGYDKNEQQQSSRIYSTTDGGETWNTTGTGPATNIIKGVKYIDEKIGFFCYEYVDGMDSNLYMTSDSGKTFSKIILEEQELDSTASDAVSSGQSESGDTASGDTKLKWSDVYKDALVPIYGSDGVITVYLTQGKNGVYNSGKTAAMYQSTDKGATFKYIGQFEINIGSQT